MRCDRKEDRNQHVFSSYTSKFKYDETRPPTSTPDFTHRRLHRTRAQYRQGWAAVNTLCVCRNACMGSAPS